MSVQEAVREQLSSAIKKIYAIDLTDFSAEIPPRTELGDLAFPVAFELAKRLKAATGEKHNPREIATRLAMELLSAGGVARVEVAGAGYINVFLDRAGYLLDVAANPAPLAAQLGGKDHRRAYGCKS